MAALAPRERRMVALLILVAAVALVWLGLVAPITSGFSDRAAEREALLATFQRDQQRAASIPRIRRQVERARLSMRDIVQVAPTAEAAQALLHDRMQAVFDGAGAEVRNLEDAGSPGTARVRVSIVATLPQLASSLQRIHNGSPYAHVDRLTIASDEAVISGKLERMEVALEISLPYWLAKSG